MTSCQAYKCLLNCKRGGYTPAGWWPGLPCAGTPDRLEGPQRPLCSGFILHMGKLRPGAGRGLQKVPSDRQLSQGGAPGGSLPIHVTCPTPKSLSVLTRKMQIVTGPHEGQRTSRFECALGTGGCVKQGLDDTRAQALSVPPGQRRLRPLPPWLACLWILRRTSGGPHKLFLSFCLFPSPPSRTKSGDQQEAGFLLVDKGPTALSRQVTPPRLGPHRALLLPWGCGLVGGRGQVKCSLRPSCSSSSQDQEKILPKIPTGRGPLSQNLCSESNSAGSL